MRHATLDECCGWQPVAAARFDEWMQPDDSVWLVIGDRNWPLRTAMYYSAWPFAKILRRIYAAGDKPNA